MQDNKPSPEESEADYEGYALHTPVGFTISAFGPGLARLYGDEYEAAKEAVRLALEAHFGGINETVAAFIYLGEHTDGTPATAESQARWDAGLAAASALGEALLPAGQQVTFRVETYFT